MTQLEAAKDNGDELKEEELLTKIVQQSIRLGVEVTTHVDHVLRKVYWGTNKFPKHFEWLDEYLAHPESQSSIFEAIQAQTEALKEIAKMPKQQFTVYPQAGSTANLGCQMQSPEFKVIPPSKEQQPALESNKEGDEDV